MSKAVIPIACVAVKDGVTNLSRPTAWTVPQGALVNTYQQVSAQTVSGASGGLNNCVCPPPSPEIIVDKRVEVQVSFRLAFQCQPLEGQPVLQLGTNDGPRAFPLMQAVNTWNATINNNTITAIMDPIIALMRYNLPFSLQQQDYTGTPCMLDQYQEYDYWNGIPFAAQPAFPYAFQNQGGALKNPLSTYGGCADTPNRGGFLMEVLQNPIGDGVTFMTAAVILTVFEPIFMTPFGQWGEEPGFYGIQTLNLSFTLNSNWWLRVWSSNFNKVGNNQAAGLLAGTLINPVAGQAWPGIPSTIFANNQITGNITDNPIFRFRYLTPSPIETLPAMMEYPYTQTLVFTTSVLAVPSVFTNIANQTITTNAIQFNTIPDQIFIYLMRQIGDRNHLTSDTFASILSVSINFMNQTALLNSVSAGVAPGSNQQKDLYNFCKANGYNGTYDQFRWLTGSVVCIKPGKDLGLEPSLAPGMNGLYNFQATLQFVNPSAFAVNYTAYIVALTSGLVTIKDNGTVTMTGLVTRMDVLSAQQQPAMTYTQAAKIVGGDFFSPIKAMSHAPWANMRPGYYGRGMYGAGLTGAPSQVGNSEGGNPTEEQQGAPMLMPPSPPGPPGGYAGPNDYMSAPTPQQSYTPQPRTGYTVTEPDYVDEYGVRAQQERQQRAYSQKRAYEQAVMEPARGPPPVIMSRGGVDPRDHPGYGSGGASRMTTQAPGGIRFT